MLLSASDSSFPYDYVYFKAGLWWEYAGLLNINFHTITSILKPGGGTVREETCQGFPYDYVYFKAEGIFWFFRKIPDENPLFQDTYKSTYNSVLYL